MMTISLRGNRIAVEKLGKSQKQASVYVQIPDSQEFVGIVRYVGDTAAQDIKVGDKVYFGNQTQNLRMGGSDICVMEDTNVLAIVNDQKAVETTTPKGN